MDFNSFNTSSSFFFEYSSISLSFIFNSQALNQQTRLYLFNFNESDFLKAKVFILKISNIFFKDDTQKKL